MPSANSHSLCTWLDKYVKQHESGARNLQPLSASFFLGGGKKSGYCCTRGSRSAAPSHLAPAAVRGTQEGTMSPFYFTRRNKARADGSGNFESRAQLEAGVARLPLRSAPGRATTAQPPRSPGGHFFHPEPPQQGGGGLARLGPARLGSARPGLVAGSTGGSSAHPIRRAGSGRSRAEPGLRFRG